MNKADKEFNKERMDTTASTGSSSSNSSDKNSNLIWLIKTVHVQHTFSLKSVTKTTI